MGALLALVLLVALAARPAPRSDPGGPGDELDTKTGVALDRIEGAQLDAYRGIVGPTPGEMLARHSEWGLEGADAGVGVAPPPKLLAAPVPITAIIEAPPLAEIQHPQPMPARGNVDVDRARELAQDVARDVEVYEGFYSPELMAEFQAEAGLYSDYMFATTNEYRADGRYGGRTRAALIYFGVEDPPAQFYGPWDPPPYILPGIGGFLS